MATETGVQVSHECGHVLGYFRTQDDHGETQICCPKCKHWVTIFNQWLMYPEDATSGDVYYAPTQEDG